MQIEQGIIPGNEVVRMPANGYVQKFVVLWIAAGMDVLRDRNKNTFP